MKEQEDMKDELDQDGPSAAGAVAPSRDREGQPVAPDDPGQKPLTREAEEALEEPLESGEELPPGR